MIGSAKFYQENSEADGKEESYRTKSSDNPNVVWDLGQEVDGGILLIFFLILCHLLTVVILYMFISVWSVRTAYNNANNYVSLLVPVHQIVVCVLELWNVCTVMKTLYATNYTCLFLLQNKRLFLFMWEQTCHQKPNLQIIESL